MSVPAARARDASVGAGVEPRRTMRTMPARTHADRFARTSRARTAPVGGDRLGLLNLVAVLLPGVAFVVALALAADRPNFGWVWPLDPTGAPGELFVIASAGAVATACGLLDWRYHRAGRRVVPRAEQRAEALALVGGGLPLFVCMAAASTTGHPRPWLLGAIVAALFATGGIVFDEVRFHRRCSRYETLLHRGLVGGNGVAFLAWFTWCLERSAGV